MSKSLPSNLKKKGGVRLSFSVITPLKHLPILATTMFVGNPILALIIYELVAAHIPEHSPFYGSHSDNTATATVLMLAFPLFWAFLAGGSNQIFLSLVRNQPAGFGTIFSKRKLARSYLLAGLLLGLSLPIMAVIGTLFVIARELLVSFIQGDVQSFRLISTILRNGIWAFLIGAAAEFTLFTRIGFFDLLIADKEIGCLDALWRSERLSHDSIGKVYLFYFLSLLALGGIYLGMEALHAQVVLEGYAAVICLTIINFWRVQMYCQLSEFQEQSNQQNVREIGQR